MSKELEALEDIVYLEYFGTMGEYAYGTIKEQFPEEYKLIESALKALEIIKEKGVNLYKLKICNSVEEYNKLCNTDLPLTQEEYDLLKEVLL